MTLAVVPLYDAIGANVALLPPGQEAGYTTGSGYVPWTAAEWAAHPGAVRIDQDPAASDATADVLDVEAGAATPADCPGWYRAALAAYLAGARPGQRYPCVYASASGLPAVANALVAAGITSGPRLWVAQWSLSQAAATAMVTSAGGPFPVTAVQYRDAGNYDISVASAAWLAAVSGPVQPPPAPVTQVSLNLALPVLAQGAAGGRGPHRSGAAGRPRVPDDDRRAVRPGHRRGAPHAAGPGRPPCRRQHGHRAGLGRADGGMMTVPGSPAG